MSVMLISIHIASERNSFDLEVKHWHNPFAWGQGMHVADIMKSSRATMVQTGTAYHHCWFAAGLDELPNRQTLQRQSS